ncbi:hypothetical protein Dimus_007766 [Dionaea muscipula]
MAALLPPTQRQSPKPDTHHPFSPPSPSSAASSPEVEDGDEPGAQSCITHEEHSHQLVSAYLGLSFSVFLSLLPQSALSLVPTLQSRHRYILLRLRRAEEQLSQLKSSCQEDSKANARVVEIFASYRNAWQQEECRFLQQIDDSSDEIARLQGRVSELEKSESDLLADVEELKREVTQRDEILSRIMSARTAEFDGDGGGAEVRVSVVVERGCGEREWDGAGVGGGLVYGHCNAFDSDFIFSGSRFWADRPNNHWQVAFDTLAGCGRKRCTLIRILYSFRCMSFEILGLGRDLMYFGYLSPIEGLRVVLYI